MPRQPKNRHSNAAPSPPRPRAVVEWFGGVLAIPASVSEQGDIFQPEVAVWADARGQLLAMSMGPPGGSGSRLLQAFESAVHKPIAGAPGRPTHLRVASPELAKLLAEHLGPSIEVRCAPTPELDAMASSMFEFITRQMDQDEEDASYLDHGVSAEQLTTFFSATAQLFRMAPWNAIPDDTNLISVTCEALGLNRAAASLIGKLGESMGLLLFQSIDDFSRFIREAERAQGPTGADAPPQFPGYLALSFEPGSSINRKMRKEVNKHRWEVASPRAYPLLLAAEPDMTSRSPSSLELTRIEALSLALTALFSAEPHIEEAWDSDRIIEHTFSVKTHAGPFEITLRAPHEEATASFSSGLFDRMNGPDGRIDLDWFREHKELLLSGFEQAPESRRLERIGWSELLMDLGVMEFNVTVAELTPAILERLLFDVIPSKVSGGPGSSSDLINEWKAFFLYLKNTHHLANMDACIQTMTPQLARRLEKQKKTPRQPGFLQAMLQQASADGFDLSTEAGVAAWVATVNGAAGASKPTTKASGAAKPRASGAARPKAKATGATKAKATGATKAKAKKER